MNSDSKFSFLETFLLELGSEKGSNHGLVRIRAALEECGRPERSVYSFVVAGTNGKGTTSLLLTSALKEAGLRIGTYLSPHLVRVNERFLDNGVPAPFDCLDKLAMRLAPLARKHQLTYFEFLTLMAFEWAKQSEFDFLILEVGLGGRLDATNAGEPLAAIITEIGLDHMELLGDTESKILAEKLGILRNELLVFTGVQNADLARQVEETCLPFDAIAYFSREMRHAQLDRGPHGQHVLINDIPFFLQDPTDAACRNAKTALLFLRILFPKLPVSLFQKAFARVKMPARFEWVSTSPPILLTGDHNPQAIQNLLEMIASLGKPVRTVCAFGPDKDWRSMLTLLEQASESVSVTAIPGTLERLAPELKSLPNFVNDAQSAVARQIVNLKKGEMLLIAGSLYLAGALRPQWCPDVRFLKDPPTSPGRFSTTPDEPTLVKSLEAALIQTPSGEAMDEEHSLPQSSTRHHPMQADRDRLHGAHFARPESAPSLSHIP